MSSGNNSYLLNVAAKDRKKHDRFIVALSLLEIGVVGYIRVSSLEWSATLEMWRDSNLQSHRGRMLWQRIGR